MSWLNRRSVVLISADFRLLHLVAAELRELGCRVFCVRNFQEAATLVRAGATNRFVLVRLGEEVFSPEELRRAMAEELPGYTIKNEDGQSDDALAVSRPESRQAPN